MRKVISILFISLTFGIYAQEKGAIGVEFNSNYNLVKTVEFDNYMDDALLNLPNNQTLISRNRIKQGIDFGLNLSYQISNLLGIGIYSKYLTSKARNETQVIIGGTIGEPLDTLKGARIFHLTNTIIGIYSDFSINKLPFWNTTNILSRFEAKFALGVGYSFSKFIAASTTNLLNGLDGEVNPVSGIHLMGNLKIGYRLAKNKVFSSIGLQIGYQMLMTRKLRGDQLLTFKKDKTPNLNFYGLTTGIYLTFGK